MPGKRAHAAPSYEKKADEGKSTKRRKKASHSLDDDAAAAVAAGKKKIFMHLVELTRVGLAYRVA